MEEKQDPWKSFETVGSRQRNRSVKVIVLLIIIAALAGGGYFYLFAS